MESEKVKEIKKALSFNERCFPYVNNNKVKYMAGETVLTLINELESENERLTKLQARGGYRVGELKDRIAELEKENGKLNERLTVFDPISAFADNCAKGLRQAEQLVLDMLMKIIERYRKKLDEQKHFYETAEISHRDISITALNTAYRYLDETLNEFLKEKE